MHIGCITISNYRSLKQAYTPLSRFSTLIGENKSGKSSFLQSIILFIRGTKLKSTDFYDPASDIVIDVIFTNVQDGDLDILAPEHKDRIKSLVRTDRTLHILRRYIPDGSSSLCCFKLLPKDKRFHPDSVSEQLKGLSGVDVRMRVEEIFPELKGIFTGTTQIAAKQKIEELISSLSTDQFVETETALPTGFDNSIKAFLPEPVYIPAVRDLSDEVKTQETTTFGRLLSILLNVISSKLSEAEETFSTLKGKLNIIRQPDGTLLDNRLDEIRQIETLVGAYVQENFPSVKVQIQIPPPEIKTVLASAKIIVDDGVEGLVDSKGDGLKRAVTFAILRSYVNLSTKQEWQKPGASIRKMERFLFLFEEPELYLYPGAQMILFDALHRISQDHQVVISTHSPLFLSPFFEGSFIKMVKRNIGDGTHIPYCEALPVDLFDVTTRDQFQLICFDNNNVAFFADKVVLVEGDSDHICLSHIAKTLNPDWDFCRKKVAMVKVSGKGSMARYRKFFERFEVKTFIVVDLDVIIRDFDKLGLPEVLGEQRSALLQLADRVIKDEGLLAKYSNVDPIKKAIKRQSWREGWEIFKKFIFEVIEGKPINKEAYELVQKLIEPELEEPRLIVLKSHPAAQNAKRELLAAVREYGIFILDKGSIEDYYPRGMEGPDKTSRAQHFCKCVSDPESIRALTNTIPVDDRETVSEFELICRIIFA